MRFNQAYDQGNYLSFLTEKFKFSRPLADITIDNDEVKDFRRLGSVTTSDGKNFYGKLYRWYETAQTQVTFPNDEQANNHTQTSLIRFLTRILFVWYLRQIGSLLGSVFEFRKIYVKQLPIPKISETDQQPFINLANKILTAKKTNQDSSNLEAQIDKLVYQLYQLTAAEIKIIETSK